MVLIYCIEDINGLKYVGSTKVNMYRRFRQHYYDSTISTRSYSSSLLDLLNSEIYELEWCEDSNRKERERYWINKIDCVNYVKLNGLDKQKFKEYKKKYDKEKRNKKYDKDYDLFRSKRVVNGCYDFIQMLNEY